MESIDQMESVATKLELAREDLKLGITKVTHMEIQDAPMPDLNASFGDYVAHLEDQGYKPVSNPDDPQVEEVMQARKEYRSLVESLSTLESDRVALVKNLSVRPTRPELASLQEIGLEIDTSSRKRDQLFETIKDLQSKMNPAAGFAVLEDAFNEVQLAEKELTGLQEGLLLEVETLQRTEEAKSEEENSVLDSLIANDPLAALGD